jgi:hypothetical protein
MATVAALVSGCGGQDTHATSEHHRASRPASVCIPGARAAVGRSLGVPTAAVAYVQSTGDNAEPQCTYKARLADGKRVTIVANVDSSPQPYFRLDRTAEEAAQVFTPGRLIPPPRTIKGLGLEADWFPTQTQLMTTDGYRLITMSFRWRGTTQKREQAVGEAVSRTYLHTPHGKTAQRIAAGLASG